MPSFDVCSEVNLQEVKNAVDQVDREVMTRYDFKGTKSEVTLDEKAMTVTLMADDKLRLGALQDLLRQKLTKRSVSLKSVTFNDAAPAGGDMIRQVVAIKQGLTDLELKSVTKAIKESKLKVTSQIQGNQVRIMGKKRDDLQTAIAFLRTKIDSVDLQFTNFRE
jgi:cyclic-di-GMP-binding protein